MADLDDMDPVDPDPEAGTALRRHAAELEQILDTIPQLISALDTEGKLLYLNRTVLKYTGLRMEDMAAADFRARLFHPEDIDRTRAVRRRGLEKGEPFELEMRTRRHATGNDIDDRKRAEERMRNECVALRDEIDRTSMFEEIVGSSSALRAVLLELNKVAPTDSTVLVTGETGTGKELFARAIHKRSSRSARAFVSVNCAAIPPALIASELFGHERGAFTGALQQRKGRFELADGGTIFLDEVGELPADAQATLLRVLQEREFERVGGSRPIQVDVRIVAATNRDLRAAVSERTFRADLFFRLSVFPLELPPLRERAMDIPLLVDYFVQRMAKRAGKRISRISQKSLALLQACPWPGNVRELQNVIERAVIVAETDVLTVDERWLARGPAIGQEGALTLDEEVAAHERARIEAALEASRGVVHGPAGAAVRLGVPRSTLESRIRTLNIDKYRFRGDHSRT